MLKVLNPLKFKEGIEPIAITDDFFYMCSSGGYVNPEKLLEPDDALRVKEAIRLITQFENQGYELGVFEEC